MKIQLIGACALVFVACDKGKPSISLSTDSDTVKAGDPIMITFSATSDKKIKKVVMESYLLKGPNQTAHYESRLYHSEDKNSTHGGQVLFVVPDTTSYAQVVEPGDHYEFKVYCEAGTHRVVQSKSVRVVP